MKRKNQSDVETARLENFNRVSGELKAEGYAMTELTVTPLTANVYVCKN